MRRIVGVALLLAAGLAGQSLLREDAWERRESEGRGTTEIVPVSGRSFAQALRIATPEAGGLRGEGKSVLRSEAAVARGEKMRLWFWVRKVEPEDRFIVRASLRLADAAGKALLDTVFPVNTAVWTYYAFDLKAERDYESGELALTFLYGQGPQIFEVGGLGWTKSAAPPALTEAGERVEPVGDWTRHAVYFDNAVGGGSAQLVAVEGESFSQAMRITTNGQSANIFGAALSWPLPRAFARDDVMHVSFWARRVSGAAAYVQAQAIVERNGGNFSKSVTLRLPVETEKWQRFQMPFRMDDTYAAGGAAFRFQFGAGPQVFEIADVTLLHYGTRATPEQLPVEFSYPGRNRSDAPWRLAALEGIEKHRKADVTVKVVDAEGKGVEGATVVIEQLSHAWRFGSAITAAGVMGNTEDDAQYRSRIESHFGTTVLENDLKWPFWEASNSFPKPRTRNAIAWLEERGIPVRGHVLIWPSWRNTPADLPALGAEELKARIDGRFHDVLQDTGVAGKLYHWDVLNEPFDNFDVQGRIGGVAGVAASNGVLGNAEAVRWFEMARRLDGRAKLYLNDYDQFESGNVNGAHVNYTFAFLKFLLDNNAPVDGFGFQSHFSSPQPLETVDQVVRRFTEEFPVEFAVTEFDVNTPDEAIQADYTREFMTYAFGQERFRDFLLWGFWERRHWLPRGAMYRADWTSKPNAIETVNLLFRDWWSEMRKETGSEGILRERVFRGRYQITVLCKDKAKMQVVDWDNGGELVVEIAAP